MLDDDEYKDPDTWVRRMGDVLESGWEEPTGEHPEPGLWRELSGATLEPGQLHIAQVAGPEEVW